MFVSKYPVNEPLGGNNRMFTDSPRVILSESRVASKATTESENNKRKKIQTNNKEIELLAFLFTLYNTPSFF